MTFQILGLSGSLRRDSLNSALLSAAASRAGDRLEIRRFGLGELPLFDQDVEEEGDPSAVRELKAALESVDGILFACPEYNFGITGVLKNAIDWGSRPPGKSPIAGKPAAIVGATPGPGGTRLAQFQLRQSLTPLGLQILPKPGFYLAGAGSKFTDGELTDEPTLEHLDGLLEAFADWIERVGG